MPNFEKKLFDVPFRQNANQLDEFFCRKVTSAALSICTHTNKTQSQIPFWNLCSHSNHHYRYRLNATVAFDSIFSSCPSPMWREMKVTGQFVHTNNRIEWCVLEQLRTNGLKLKKLVHFGTKQRHSNLIIATLDILRISLASQTSVKQTVTYQHFTTAQVIYVQKLNLYCTRLLDFKDTIPRLQEVAVLTVSKTSLRESVISLASNMIFTEMKSLIEVHTKRSEFCSIPVARKRIVHTKIQKECKILISKSC